MLLLVSEHIAELIVVKEFLFAGYRDPDTPSLPVLALDFLDLFTNLHRLFLIRQGCIWVWRLYSIATLTTTS